MPQNVNKTLKILVQKPQQNPFWHFKYSFKCDWWRHWHKNKNNKEKSKEFNIVVYTLHDRIPVFKTETNERSATVAHVKRNKKRNKTNAELQCVADFEMWTQAHWNLSTRRRYRCVRFGSLHSTLFYTQLTECRLPTSVDTLHTESHHMSLKLTHKRHRIEWTTKPCHEY